MKIKKLLKFIGAAAACITFAAAGTIFASADTGAFDVSGGTEGTDYSYENNVLTIKTSTSLTIKNNDPNTATTTDTIVVASENGANIMLNGVNIDVSSASNVASFKIDGTTKGKVTITLADGSENTLKSGICCAGLQKSNASSYNLEITGTGKLDATGGPYGAGIGGGESAAGSNITISGGEVIAYGGVDGAAIGGGSTGEGSNITINGSAKVTATGNTNGGGAGIGGGSSAKGSDIKIGGNAIVTATGGKNGAGIGGARSGTNITISDNATVTATGGRAGGAGIGSCNYSGSNITISGGTVTATGANGGAGIGGGLGGTGSNIIITGGSVKATGSVNSNFSYSGAAIGNGATSSADGTAVTPTNSTAKVYLLELDSATSSLTIDGKAYPADHGDGKVYVYLTEGKHTIVKDGVTTICAFASYNGGLIEIGSDLKITPTNSGETLTYGTDYTYTNGVLTILSDKAVTIKNYDDVATTSDRIEVAKDKDANITLAGVNIDVSSTSSAAAFKIADNSTGNVTITLVGENKLYSANDCAGLQKNGDTSTGKLTITGTGSLEAVGGDDNGAGIGGGNGQPASNITIENGTVYARSRGYGAGIGGGNSGAGSNITISGGVVTARGGTDAYGTYSGAGIGGGNGGAGSNIVISGGSVYVCGGLDRTDVIGGGAGQDPVTPVDGNGNEVYLLTLDTDGTSEVTIDGKTYPKKHDDEKRIYAYLTGEAHIVKVGTTETVYVFDSAKKEFKLPELTISATNSDKTLTKSDFTYVDGVLTILTATPVTIKNADTTKATTDHIEVAKDISANITLAGVNIDVSEISKTAAFKIADDSEGNVTITLADDTVNILKGGYECAGLQKKGVYISADKGKLTIQGGTNGTGALEATGGGYGAGIGGGYNGTGSNITISGGIITAQGGSPGGAGIGGGYKSYASNITISGGFVTATDGNSSAAGIGEGGGSITDASNIIISGGSVKATRISATPIDKNGDKVYLLKIKTDEASEVKIDGVAYPKQHVYYENGEKKTENTVYAYVKDEAHIVKIGDTETLYTNDSLTYTFKPAELSIKPTNASDELVLGVDYTYDCCCLVVQTNKPVTITNVDFTKATSDCIDVYGSFNVNITLAGVNINSSDYAFFAGASNTTITLADNTQNILKSSSWGGIYVWSEKSLEIKGNGSLEATGSDGHAGIGGSNITISGGVITAQGGSNGGAGIGGDNGAGIGGGAGSPAWDIVISGGSVKAIAGEGANAIGGGAGQDAVTPTDGNGHEVYLLEIGTDGASEVTIDGKTYPKKHGDENKIYAYLPAKMSDTVVKVGDNSTSYTYDGENLNRWLRIVEKPNEDTTAFVYNGSEWTYSVDSSLDYTVSGDKQTNAGEHKVKFTLTDTENTVWRGGATELEYPFNIAKADPSITVVATPASEIAGKTISVTATATNPNNAELTDLPEIALSYQIDDGTKVDFTGSFVIPKDTKSGAKITIYAKTAESANYNAAVGTASVVVTDCEHPNKPSAWEKDDSAHYHVCPDCGAEVDKAPHSFATDGNCTVCGHHDESAVVTTTTTPAPDTEPSGGSTTPSGSFTTPSYIGPRPNVVTTTTTATTTTTTTANNVTTAGGSTTANSTTTITDTTTTPVYDEPFIVGDNGKIGWEVIEEQIDETPDGEKLIIDMNGTTKLPETILEAIMGRDVTIVLEMDNGFAWTINGADVTDPKTVDLAVTTGSSIKAKVVNALTGECSYIEITLKHNGEFGFTATLTVKLGKENKGLFANLYYYNDDGEFELISSGKIGKSGKADLEFTHASEYVIVIDDYDHAAESDVASDVEKADNVETPNETPNDVVIEVPTDEDGNPITGVTISFSAVILAGAVVMATKKKRK